MATSNVFLLPNYLETTFHSPGSNVGSDPQGSSTQAYGDNGNKSVSIMIFLAKSQNGNHMTKKISKLLRKRSNPIFKLISPIQSSLGIEVHL